MELHIEMEREDDGRWLAEVVELPGVMAYGPSPEAAALAVKICALRAIADKLEHDDLPLDLVEVSFVGHSPSAS